MPKLPLTESLFPPVSFDLIANEDADAALLAWVVELARLCAHPDHRELTRVALRLWRVLAPVAWGRAYWPVKALVSYANAVRHKGDIYRFDGWRKVADVKGGSPGTGTTWGRPRKAGYEAKSVWAFDLPNEKREAA
jgi:hypothetical protein